MKKILSLLSTFVLIGTTATTVVSCQLPTRDKILAGLEHNLGLKPDPNHSGFLKWDLSKMSDLMKVFGSNQLDFHPTTPTSEPIGTDAYNAMANQDYMEAAIQVLAQKVDQVVQNATPSAYRSYFDQVAMAPFDASKTSSWAYKNPQTDWLQNAPLNTSNLVPINATKGTPLDDKVLKNKHYFAPSGSTNLPQQWTWQQYYNYNFAATPKKAFYSGSWLFGQILNDTTATYPTPPAPPTGKTVPIIHQTQMFHLMQSGIFQPPGTPAPSQPLVSIPLYFVYDIYDHDNSKNQVVIPVQLYLASGAQQTANELQFVNQGVPKP